MKQAFQLLKINNWIIRSCKGCIDYALIKSAENHLGVLFPKSYKEFLSQYGFISLGGCEIFGIIDSDFINSEVPDAVWLAMDNRKNFNFPKYLIPIYDVGEGTTYCLDTSQMNEEGECPVVAWPLGGYGQTPVLEIVAKDFGEFFLNKVKEQIELKAHE
jgi:hypothetical protein